MPRRGIQLIGVRVIVASAGVALIATACGSAPTVASFNSHANSICQTYSARLRSLSAELALLNHESGRQLESTVSSTLSLMQEGSTQLQALGRPSGEGDALAKAFKSQNAQLADLDRLLSAIKQGDATRIESTETEFEESEAPLNQRFDVLGLAACGSG